MNINKHTNMHQKNVISKIETSHINVLGAVLWSHQIPDDEYSLNGYVEGCICLEKVKDNWVVFSGERGQRLQMSQHKSIKSACLQIIKELSDSMEVQEDMEWEYMQRVTNLLGVQSSPLRTMMKWKRPQQITHEECEKRKLSTKREGASKLLIESKATLDDIKPFDSAVVVVNGKKIEARVYKRDTKFNIKKRMTQGKK